MRGQAQHIWRDGLRLCAMCREYKAPGTFRTVTRKGKSYPYSYCLPCEGKLVPQPATDDGLHWCVDCQEYLPISMFHKAHARGKQYFQSRCKAHQNRYSTMRKIMLRADGVLLKAEMINVKLPGAAPTGLAPYHENDEERRYVMARTFQLFCE